jgi:hypothetical protein
MTGPGHPTLGKSEYREPVHDDCLRGVTNEVPADFFESPPAPAGDWIVTHPDDGAVSPERYGPKRALAG